MTDERRSFARYPRESVVHVLHAGHVYSGKSMDYSLDGFGATLNDTPLGVGDEVSFNLDDPPIAGAGNVVWTARSKGGLRVGVHRTGMLGGTLRDFRLADVLLGLTRSGRTGTLQISGGSISSKIYFSAGTLLYASSPHEDDSLGRVLLAAGKITNAQYAESLETSKRTGKKHGSVLVELGFIPPQALFWAVQSSAEGIIFGSFNLKDAEFHFTDGPGGDDVVSLKLSPASVIYRGIALMKDADHVMSLLPPTNSVLCFSSDPLDLFQDLMLDPQDKAILRLVDCKRTIADIVRQAGTDRFRALKAILAFLSTRTVEIGRPSDKPIADEEVEEIVRGYETELSHDFAERVSELYRTHESLGYYGVLDIPRDADKSIIKKAYYQKAKEFHPDKHYHMADDIHDMLNTIFTYVTTAYATLNSPARRAEYDARAGEKPAAKRDPLVVALKKCEEGKRIFAKGEYEQALKLFSEAVYYDDSNHLYQYYLGATLLRCGRGKEAEKALRRALTAEPQNPAYLAEIGHAYLALGLAVRARGNFKKALSLDPGNKRAKQGMVQATEAEKQA